MFERALVIEYLSQSRYKTISGIRMKNSIFESHFGKMLLTWVTLMLKRQLINGSQSLDCCTPCQSFLLEPEKLIFFMPSSFCTV